MLLPLSDVYSITKIAVKNDDEAYLGLVLDEIGLDPGNPHTALYTLTKDLASQVTFYPKSVVGMCHSDIGGPTLITLAESGEVYFHQGGDVREENITREAGPLRDLCIAGTQPIACGTNLQLMRRTSSGVWASFGLNEGLREDFGSIHLEAVDAYNENEVYAVGRSGTIMWYNGDVWHPIQCPTNLSFLSVCCGSDGVVYAGGQAGLVASGRHGSFTVSTPDNPLNDVWGIQEFAGKTYCAMMRALMTWSPEDGLNVVPDAMENTLTFYNLEVGSNVLWSVGESDVIRYDGNTWTRIDAVNVQ